MFGERHHGYHNHAAGVLGSHGGADVVRADFAVGAYRAPILLEGSKWIAGILLRMLFPIRVSIPKRIGLFVITMLDGGEELIDGALLAPIPEVINEESGYREQHEPDDQIHAAPAIDARIVFLSFKDSHVLGIRHLELKIRLRRSNRQWRLLVKWRVLQCCPVSQITLYCLSFVMLSKRPRLERGYEANELRS